MKTLKTAAEIKAMNKPDLTLYAASINVDAGELNKDELLVEVMKQQEFLQGIASEEVEEAKAEFEKNAPAAKEEEEEAIELKYEGKSYKVVGKGLLIVPGFGEVKRDQLPKRLDVVAALLKRNSPVLAEVKK